MFLVKCLQNSFDFQSRACQMILRKGVHFVSLLIPLDRLFDRTIREFGKDPRHERRGRETLLSSLKPNFERILRIGTRFWSWFDLFLFGQKGPRKWFQARVNPSRRLISPPLQDETTSLSIFSRCLTRQVRDLPFRGIRGSRGSNIEIFWPTYVLI